LGKQPFLRNLKFLLFPMFLFSSQPAVNRWKFGTYQILTAFVLCLFLGFDSAAQINNYTFSQLTEAYPEVVPDSTMGTASTDDQNFNGIRLGFLFNYNGQNYDRVSVNFNGYIAMGPTCTNTFSDGCYSVANASGRCLNTTTTSAKNNVVAAFNMDIQATGYSQFGIKRLGTAPNRSMVVQWKNVRRYASSAGNDTINFQIRFYESTNMVEYRYGRIKFQIDQPSGPLRVQAGLRGNSASEFLCRQSEDNWTATGPGTVNTDGIRVSPSVFPPSGLTFRYSPLPPAPNDLGIIAVLTPTAPLEGCVLTTNEKVKVVVKNYGTNGQTSLPLGYRINNGTVVDQTFTRSTPLAFGAQDTLEFSTGANLSTEGTFRIIAFSKLPNEQPINRVNDTLLNYTLTLKPARNLPQPIATTLSVATQNGWTQGRGRTKPSGNAGSWTTAFPFASESIGLTFSPTSSTIQDWLISPAINVTEYSVLFFRAAITANAFGTTAVSGIGDDSVKVRISLNCGQTWTTIKTFKQADLTNDTISNAMRQFRYKLTGQPVAKILIAFQGLNNNTPGTDTYRFHLDDIEIREVPPFDAGVISVLSPKAASPGCVLSASENIRFVITNTGSNNFNSLQAGYSVNNGSPVFQTFTLAQPLIPGKTDTLTFNGAQAVNLSQAGDYFFKVFTNLTGELPTTHANDTVRNYRVRLSAPFPVPSTLITNLATGTANSWKKGRGNPVPVDTVSSWFSSFAFGSTETISVLSTTGASNLREWYISPSYSVGSDAILVCKVGVARGNITALPNANMGDDTLKILVTEDCGATWRVIKKFSQADVLAGTVKDSLKRFVFPLNITGGKVGIAFFFQNLTTPAASTYRVHIKDIQVRPPLLNNDIGVSAILAPNNNVAFCRLGTEEPVKVVVTNYGINPQTSSTVAYKVGAAFEKSANFTFTPGPLLPGQSDTLEFSGTNGANLSTYNTFSFSAYTKLSNEDPGGISNDTLKNYVIRTRAPLSGPSFVEFFDDNLNMPSGWVAGNRDNFDFVVREDRGYGGTNAMSAYFTIANQLSAVNSPRYLIPASQLNALIFKFRMSDRSGDPFFFRGRDSLVIRYTENCGATYTTLMKLDSANYTPNNQYQDTSFVLNGLSGKEVMFTIAGHIAKQDTTKGFLDIDNWIIEQTLSAKSFLSANEFSVYPNPARNQVMVSSEKLPIDRIRLMDLSGREIISNTYPSLQNAGLTVKQIPAGLYLIQVFSGTGSRVFKLEILN
jgi:hypothetical protein